nr:HK97 family phage prohead protease [Pseudomonadota bacterium]
NGGVRRILEADLWEISVVTFPMLPDARIETVKGRRHPGRGRLPTTREFESWLTRDAGLTRGEARCVIAKGFATLLRGRDAAPGRRLTDRIRAATRMMTTPKTRTWEITR